MEITQSLENDKMRILQVIHKGEQHHVVQLHEIDTAVLKRLGCPYYPRGAKDLHFMIDENSIKGLKKITERLTKKKTVVVLLANEQSLPMLANWFCVARQNVMNITDNLLIVVPHENSSMVDNLKRKGINAVQMRFRYATMQLECFSRVCVHKNLI